LGSLKEKKQLTVNLSVNMGTSPTERMDFQDEPEPSINYDEEDEELEYYDQHEDYTPEVFVHQEENSDEDSDEFY
jgi:hypothetical protein